MTIDGWTRRNLSLNSVLMGPLVGALLVCVLTFPAYAQFFEQRDFYIGEQTDLEKIFKQGLTRGGKKLNLSGKQIGDKGLELLLTMDYLGKVTSLDLRYNELSEKGARLLANSKAFPKLKKLDLRHNYFLDNGAVALAESPNFPKLEKIVLSFNEVRDQGALAFAQSKNFPKLKKLDLSGNFLSDKTKSTLKKDLAHLQSLKLF